MKKLSIKIKDLFAYLQIDNTQYEVVQHVTNNIYVQTPTGTLTPILGYVKKCNNKIIDITLENKTSFKCSENHIIIDKDNQVLAKDATTVLTLDGNQQIINKEFVKYGDVYDISIGDPHLYVTPNNVIHHNTSLARIIVNDILKCNYIYINASDESGIDTIRHNITNFAQTKSFDGGIKVVILDECLEENTLVTVLADGVVKQLPIKNLDDKNHLVKTYNVATDTIEWRPFNHACQGEREVYEIEFENGEKIICTDTHKWYVHIDGKIERKKLKDIINEGITDIITKTDDVTMLAQLKIKTIKKLSESVVVYDIGVNKTNNFFVGKSQILTGNCDGLTGPAQAALRNTMESYSKTTRFILTGNYKHKIIPALQSRCQSIEIKPVIEAAVRRCYSILKSEDITVSEEQKKKFIELVKVNFPDIRKTINELQKNCVDKELCIENIHVDSELLKNIYNHITNKDVITLRKYLIENESRFNSDYDNLLVELLEHIYAQNIDDLRKKKMISIIADHLYKSSFVTDKEINCFACFITLELC